MTSLITTLLIVGGIAFAFMNRCEWFQLCGPIGDLFKGGGTPSGSAAAAAPAAAASKEEKEEYEYDEKGEYKAPAGGYVNTGGYKGTPGWYTINGHHHCNKGEAGCVCTDPKKCLGIHGTGSAACKGGKCAPGPGQCRPDLGRYGATPCGDCPSGTGGGKCAGGTYKAKFGTVSSRYTISNSPSPYLGVNSGGGYIIDDIEGRYIDPDIKVRNNRVVYNPFVGRVKRLLI